MESAVLAVSAASGLLVALVVSAASEGLAGSAASVVLEGLAASGESAVLAVGMAIPGAAIAASGEMATISITLTSIITSDITITSRETPTAGVVTRGGERVIAMDGITGTGAMAGTAATGTATGGGMTTMTSARASCGASPPGAWAA